MIAVHFQGKPFNITVLQVYAPTTNPKQDVGPHVTIQDLLEQTQKKKKKSLFHQRGMVCKSRTSGDT